MAPFEGASSESSNGFLDKEGELYCVCIGGAETGSGAGESISVSGVLVGMVEVVLSSTTSPILNFSLYEDGYIPISLLYTLSRLM